MRGFAELLGENAPEEQKQSSSFDHRGSKTKNRLKKNSFFDDFSIGSEDLRKLSDEKFTLAEEITIEDVVIVDKAKSPVKRSSFCK